MRYSASEKFEIIELVQQSSLSMGAAHVLRWGGNRVLNVCMTFKSRQLFGPHPRVFIASWSARPPSEYVGPPVAQFHYA